MRKTDRKWADPTAQTEVPDSWIAQFLRQIRYHPGARDAWRRLERAGLEQVALFLLWGYAGGADSELHRMHGLVSDASDRLKAAERAEKKSQIASPKRASNPRLFGDRAERARQDALNAQFPLGGDTVRAELSVASRKGKKIPLRAVRKALVKAGGVRSPVSRLHFLFLLQGHAARHGVTLGNKRLPALANCADPSRHLHPSALGRYLAAISKQARNAMIRDTLPTLPPHSKNR